MNYFIPLLLSLCFSAPTFAAETSNLRDKIGQMLLIGFDGKEINAHSSIVKTIQKSNIGGVILFDFNYNNKTFDKNIKNKAQVRKLNQDLHYFAQQGNLKYHRPQLPLLISVDYEGGYVTRISTQYGFPPTLSAATVGKKGITVAKANAHTMAQTLKKAGFNLNFAPDLDVNVNPKNPIIGKKERSFSNNPYEVIRYASVYTRYFLKQKIQCVYKHFPGHGSSTKDSHTSLVDVSTTWKKYELIPFKKLIQAQESCGAIMSAHIVNRQLDASGLPATLSHKILTDLLRKQLHFKGVIITDDMQMKAISSHYGLEKALVLAINAGADMIIFGNNLSSSAENPERVIDLIEANVQSGAISHKRIDEAYQRIVHFKKLITSPKRGETANGE